MRFINFSFTRNFGQSRIKLTVLIVKNQNYLNCINFYNAVFIALFKLFTE